MSDPHQRVADKLGITREQAKVLNYGAKYGNKDAQHTLAMQRPAWWKLVLAAPFMPASLLMALVERFTALSWFDRVGVGVGEALNWIEHKILGDR